MNSPDYQSQNGPRIVQDPMLMIMDRNCGRLNLAFQNLQEVPLRYIDKYGQDVRELDLTSNNIRDFRFLLDLPNLETLIVDRNQLNSHVKFPFGLNLTTLWINHNRISNLSIFMRMLAQSCPGLKFLSMMNNEAAPSYFNGGSFVQYQDYRHYVISRLERLLVLDDTPVRTEEKEESTRIYGQSLRSPDDHTQRKKREKRHSRKKLTSGETK